MIYQLDLPPRVLFGWGRSAELGRITAEFGVRAAVVAGSRSLGANGVIDRLTEALAQAGVDIVHRIQSVREPRVEDVDVAARAVRDAAADVVVAIGGGSAIDLGKAVAALATNRHGTSVADFLEGVGRGLQITEPPLPVIAVPTTAGTGSEATKNAVISSDDPPFKKSLRSPQMIPRAVIIDPELTVSAPPSVTAHSGMDAITQLIESYISCRATVVTRPVCLAGLQAAVPALETAVVDGQSREAREAMAHAAFLSGLALANSGLGIAHGVAAALGIHCGLSHGLACAVMLPIALRANLTTSVADLAELSRQIFADDSGDALTAAMRFVDEITALNTCIGIPDKLSEIGVSAHMIPALVAGSHGNSRNGNPRAITDEELAESLEAAL